jgi:hypothetical protein
MEVGEECDKGLTEDDLSPRLDATDWRSTWC